MTLQIKATNFELTPALREYVEEKIGSLEKLVQRFDTQGAVEVHVEVARTTRHHHKGAVYRAEANLHLPHKLLRAEDENFEMRIAVDRVRDKLRREVEKHKTALGRE